MVVFHHTEGGPVAAAKIKRNLNQLVARNDGSKSRSDQGVRERRSVKATAHTGSQVLALPTCMYPYCQTKLLE